MKNSTLKAMVFGLAAAMTLTCVAPAAVFAAAPSDFDPNWEDVTDDDNFYAEDENGEFHSRDYFEDVDDEDYDDFEDVDDEDYDDFEDVDDDEDCDDFEDIDDDEDYDDYDVDEDYDDVDDYDDDDFVDVTPTEETGRDIVNNSHAGYSYANCRVNPGLDSDILFTIPNGTRVYTTGRVVNRNGFDWYEVHLAGAYDYGWIAGHLIGR